MTENEFSGHERKARQRIAQWSLISGERLWLAHGRFTATPGGVMIELKGHFTKGLADQTTRQLSALEMLDLLVRLEAGQTALAQQLGQVRAAARRARQT